MAERDAAYERARGRVPFQLDSWWIRNALESNRRNPAAFLDRALPLTRDMMRQLSADAAAHAGRMDDEPFKRAMLGRTRTEAWTRARYTRGDAWRTEPLHRLFGKLQAQLRPGEPVTRGRRSRAPCPY